MKKGIQRLKEFRKFFKKFITKNYGKKCRDYCFSCPVCRVWRIYEDFDSWVEDVEDLEKCEEKIKNKQ